MQNKLVPLILTISLIGLFQGCAEQKEITKTLLKPEDVFDGTIGTYCELSGYTDIQVNGYSLVWGLPGTGSSECPPKVKAHLKDLLYKEDIRSIMGAYYDSLTSDQIIESQSTAVVLVTGKVPAGSPRGAKFDVSVSALASTQTTSLNGGQLFPTPLHLVSTGSSSKVLAGRSVAIAQGPVFVNPFPMKQTNGELFFSDTRQGSVIGGATSIRDRNIQMVLLSPSYRLARQIQSRLNSRFPSEQSLGVAEGLSRNMMRLNIPERYSDNYQHFISLALSVYLNDTPGYQEQKQLELNALAEQENADFEAITLAWEAIGKPCLDHLETLYETREDELGFYAARTALNMNDLKAIDRLISIARIKDHVCRKMAAEVLANHSDDFKVRKLFRDLLNTNDVELCVIAYEALRNINDSTIAKRRLPSGFDLDMVRSQGQNLLYVWMKDQPRIVIFGENIQCYNNVFFETENRKLMINVPDGSRQCNIIFQLPKNNEELRVNSALTLSDLITTLSYPRRKPGTGVRSGVGLSFSEIAGILYEMCQEDQHIIPAKFVLQRSSMAFLGS